VSRNEPARTAEVAIVGAGVTGLAVAFHLRERGVRAVVLERSGVGSGASGVQPGGVRQQWGTRVNCVLARESLAFHREARERLGARVDPGFRACGYLFLAHSQPALERLRANVAVQHAAGVPSSVVSPDEAARYAPGLATESIVGAAWCGEDGYYDRPQAVVEALAEGTDVVLAEVRSLHPEGDFWRLRLGDGQEVTADQVVVAAAADTAVLLRPLGVELPIELERRWIFLGAPIRERLLEPLVVSPERHFAVKQLADGRVMASDLSAVADAADAPAWLAAIRRCIRELVPRLEYVDFAEVVSGVYDVTPDRQAIIGRAPGQDGLWVAAGFSGHGFMLAPAVGRILAEAIMGSAEDEALSVLDAHRFGAGRLVPEPQVV
jgi:sarcosine oxidase subunit beta